MNGPFSPTGNRRGVALLLVIVTILLVTVALVSVTRRSLLLALTSAEQIEDLQERWSLTTLENAGLSAAANCFTAHEQYFRPNRRAVGQESVTQIPPGLLLSHHELDVMLNGKTYHLVLADESAKANLNQLVTLHDTAALDRLAVALSGGRIVNVSRVILPPNAPPAPLQSWGQVLSVNTSSSGSVSVVEIPEITRQLTIWGNSPLQILRAEDVVLDEVSRMVLSGGQSRDWIQEYRQSFPKRTPDEILKELGVDEKARRKLVRLFGERTSTVSLWIVDESRNEVICCVADRSSSGSWGVTSVRYAR